MRLIDADISDVVIIYDKSNELTKVSAIREYIERQKAFLDKFPTIDAVPVVRCRECKHLNVVNRKELYAHCPKTNTVFLPFELDTREHFCSLGERKEGADNDT